jgi:hypothetical protein
VRLEAGYWPPWAPNRARKRLIPNIFRQKTPHQRCTSDPTRKIKPLCRGSLRGRLRYSVAVLGFMVVLLVRVSVRGIGANG